MSTVQPSSPLSSDTASGFVQTQVNEIRWEARTT